MPDPILHKLFLAGASILGGVGAVWFIFWAAHWLVERLPFRQRERLMPAVFLGPAMLLLAVFLVYPAVRTLLTSLTEDVLPMASIVPEANWGSPTIAQDWVGDQEGLAWEGYLVDGRAIELARVRYHDQPAWILIRPQTHRPDAGAAPARVFTVTPIGFQNYSFALTSPDLRVAFRNNLLWLTVGTGVSVGLGLFIAALVDRIRYESAAKSIIFAPLSISFVGASVVWRFVYAWQPPGRMQVGLLNSLVTGLGGEPIAWLLDAPRNTLALIVIMIWLQTGFCMVVFSAALKNLPQEVLEAARIDGANELQAFLRVSLPMIRGTILTVGTTVWIAVLKVFDIVYVMTGGRFDTEVMANRMFVEMFTFRNFGRASALAVILLLVVLPIMVLNVRRLRAQGLHQ